MTREPAAIVRFLLFCAAFALGQTLTVGLVDVPFAVVIPAALGIGVLALTEGLGRPRATGGDPKYWRGRRVEDEERHGRWN